MSPSLQRPTTNQPEAWQAYWKAQGRPWRSEPEIDAQRQEYLAERRAIVPDVERGIYPFKDVGLSRADVEWLLATHEDGRGPVDWSDPEQRTREGLDLRGADLRRACLQGLPLARLRAGLSWYRKSFQTVEQLDAAAIYLEKADLREAHLEGATLRGAHLERADLSGAFLEEADLSRTHLEAAHLRQACLRKAMLIRAHLEWADLPEAHLEETSLSRAHLEGVHLREAHLEGADLRRAFLDLATNLDRTHIATANGESVLLAGIHWGDANLTLLDWGRVKLLGDERMARKTSRPRDHKDNARRLMLYEDAVRANRQLAVALQAQGLNEDAARFAYRAQVLQRSVFWFQMTRSGATLRQRMQKCGSLLFSWFLFGLAGYGYKFVRTIIWYLVIIFGFAAAYFAFGHLPPFPDALVFSLTSFHGRGFFPGLGSETSLHNPLVVLAAAEAVIGLFIEISFIATFTKRFFGS